MKMPAAPQKKTPLKPLNVEISADLFNAIKEEAYKRDEFMKQAVEWGLKAYLLRFSPKRAEKLKILCE